MLLCLFFIDCLLCVLLVDLVNHVLQLLFLLDCEAHDQPLVEVDHQTCKLLLDVIGKFLIQLRLLQGLFQRFEFLLPVLCLR